MSRTRCFAYRYANKLIPGIGLALSFYDMLTCGEGKIKWGDGLVWHKSKQCKHRLCEVTSDRIDRCPPPANFRLVVFAPIEAEVIVGTVHSSTTDHIRGEPTRLLLDDAANKRPFQTVSLGFFSDIYIPTHALPPNTFL
jgi:DNA-directed RNA polymerase III subunit RPC8